MTSRPTHMNNHSGSPTAFVVPGNWLSTPGIAYVWADHLKDHQNFSNRHSSASAYPALLVRAADARGHSPMVRQSISRWTRPPAPQSVVIPTMVEALNLRAAAHIQGKYQVSDYPSAHGGIRGLGVVPLCGVRSRLRLALPSLRARFPWLGQINRDVPECPVPRQMILRIIASRLPRRVRGGDCVSLTCANRHRQTRGNPSARRQRLQAAAGQSG